MTDIEIIKRLEKTNGLKLAKQLPKITLSCARVTLSYESPLERGRVSWHVLIAQEIMR
jgi:hypothetical protein